jgi:hypothetical protein
MKRLCIVVASRLRLLSLAVFAVAITRPVVAQSPGKFGWDIRGLTGKVASCLTTREWQNGTKTSDYSTFSRDGRFLKVCD